jgi:RNA polymerase sigma-70 factor (ECF subfamily)
MSPSWPNDIVGRDKVVRLLAGIAAQLRALPGVTFERTPVNGQPGAVVRDGSGAVINVFSFDIADGAVQTVRSVISRQKLAHLGPLADIDALRAAVGPSRRSPCPRARAVR